MIINPYRFAGGGGGSLVSFYRLTEDAGNPRLDSHTGGLTLSLAGGSSISVENGYINRFANQAYLQSSDAAYNFSGSFSFVGWVRPADGYEKYIAAVYGGVGSRSWAVRQVSSNSLAVRLVVMGGGSEVTATSTDLLSTSELRMVCARFTAGEKLSISINGGTPVETATAVTSPDSGNGAVMSVFTANDYTITWNTSSWAGRVRGFSFWSGALSNDQVSALYALGAGATYADTLAISL